MEGFIRRIWGEMGIDKVVAIGKVIFVVRLTLMEQHDPILNGVFQFFDKKTGCSESMAPGYGLEKGGGEECLDLYPITSIRSEVLGGYYKRIAFSR